MRHGLFNAIAASALLAVGATGTEAATVAQQAPTVNLRIDDSSALVGANRVVDSRGKTVYLIENYENVGLGVRGLNAFMDPDPIITAGISVIDFGSPTSFNFLFSLPIVPTIGPVTLTLTLEGTCTDVRLDGCSATPDLTSGFLADGLLDGMVKVSGGSAFSGLAGSTGSFASSVFTVNLPAGPYNTLGLNLGFLGSGIDDVIAFKMSVEVVNAPIPEPSSLALLVLGLGAVGAAARRRKP